MLRNLYFLFLFFFVFKIFLYAQNKKDTTFEGTIVYEKADLNDTVAVKMYFKDDKVRIDYYNKNNELQKYKIFNFSDNKLMIVNPLKLLYVEKNIHSEKLPLDSDAEIKKTANHKTILGQEAYQWIVKNNKRNTVISYWVLPENYDNFRYIFEAMGRSNKIIGYYSHIPDSRGYILLDAEEFSLIRDRRMRFRAIMFEKSSPDSKLFELPANYELFE